MMENAGRGLAQAIIDWMDVAGRSVLVLVGPGNNGGDGLVAGRYLAQAGAEPSFYLYKPRAKDDANYAKIQEMALPITLAADDQSGETLRQRVIEADIVLDALLGTGTDRPIGGDLKTLLERCAEALGENRNRRAADYEGPCSPTRLSYRSAALPLVVAVDCPSGLNCDTGAVDPVTIPADLTVTFAAPKIGQFRFPGAASLGELLVADIGSPEDLPTLQAVELELATADSVRDTLPPRPLDGHKGSFGKVMIAAGSINYTGAAALAGEAAYRTGAGLVTLAVPAAIHSPLAAQLTETTFLILPHSMGAINENAAQVLLDSLVGYDALLVGPGLGRDENTRRFLNKLLAGGISRTKGRIGFVAGRAEKEPGDELPLPPLVVDADGLNLLSEIENWSQKLPARSILTPHPGEMARLLKCKRDEIAADRVGIARHAATEWGHVVVLKGAFTVVVAPDGQTTLLPFANPALATAGTGDVLAGAILALLGMGLEPYSAAVSGAYLHGAAGQRASEEIGRSGVLAGDLSFFLATVLAEMQD
jgi:NAD(P)H-hydrate epimerase